MNKIKASDELISNILHQTSHRKETRISKMKHTKKIIASLVACAVLLVGANGLDLFGGQETPINNLDLTERILVDPNAPSACQMVNVEGTIVKVFNNGLSFVLDTGKTVHVTDHTEIGITTPTAAKKEDQFFEPTFRVGNNIAGFTENEESNEFEAYAIYTNWNWDDPIR